MHTAHPRRTLATAAIPTDTAAAVGVVAFSLFLIAVGAHPFALAATIALASCVRHTRSAR